MAFERFTDVGRVFRPRASIRSNGQIGFNHGSVKRFDMQKYSFAVLFYDKENRKVGVKLTNDKTEAGASSLITRSGNGTVSARAFLEYYRLLPKITTQHDIEWDEENKLLVVDIGKGSQRTRKKIDREHVV
ncbi:MAG: hypothetical protein WAN12_14925 [Candidatus Acidiferrum sp.]